MAMLAAPALVDLLPFEVSAWVTARAGREGVTPDALVLVMLRGYQRIVDAAESDRGLPPVPAVWLLPAVPVTTVHTERATIYDGITDALVARSPSDVSTIRAWLVGAGRWRWHVRTLREGLSDMATRGRIRRVRRGVYATA